jgi:hypothetical protein
MTGRGNLLDPKEGYPMTVDTRVCWIDRAYDRDYASNRHGRYAAYLVGHAELFAPWRDAGAGGITQDPVDFAIAAFQVATGPIMSPGYVRWHGRVQGHSAGRSEQDGRLLLSVTLATPAPLRLPWSWRGWQQSFLDGRYVEPRDDQPAGLASLELRWPIGTDQLHPPTPPRVRGVPNLRDAARAVEVLVEHLNATIVPVLADLEAGG